LYETEEAPRRSEAGRFASVIHKPAFLLSNALLHLNRTADD
jgi:hypothetical protein